MFGCNENINNAEGNKTNEFYSCFCGINISEAVNGISFVCSDSRNDEVKGFGYKYSI